MIHHDPVTRRSIAVSETVGFIIIFGIMMTGIAIVTLYGYPTLVNSQADANVRNMERNMIVLQSDLNSLTFKNVPYKESTLQISGGTFLIENPGPDKTFRISNSTGHQFIPAPNNEFHPGEIRYVSGAGDVIVGLQNGAVVKWQNGGSTMLSKPRWYLDEGTLVITLIQIQGDSNGISGTSGFSNVQMAVNPLYGYIENQSPDDVIINYTDKQFDYYTAWKNYFNSDFASTTSSIVVVPNVEKLVIRSYNVTILSL